MLNSSQTFRKYFCPPLGELCTGGSEVVMPDAKSPTAGGSEVVTPYVRAYSVPVKQISNVEKQRLTPPCHSSRAATMSKMATTSKTTTAKTDKNVQGQAAHAAQHSTDSNISKTLPEQFDKWISMLLYTVYRYIRGHSTTTLTKNYPILTTYMTRS